MWLTNETLPQLVAISFLCCALSIWVSRRHTAWWYLDPRGPLSIVLLLHTVGVPIYTIWHDRYPNMFGLNPGRIATATLLTLLFQIGILLGTFVPTSSQGHLRWELTAGARDRFFSVLGVAVLLTDSPAWIGLATGGYARLIHSHYGEGQGLEGSDWMSKVTGLANVAYIAVPTLTLLIVALGLSRRHLLSWRLAALVAFAGIPVLLSGGRRDIVIIFAAFTLARALRSERPRWLLVLAGALALTLLSMALAASRSGDSLSPNDRIEAVRNMADLESDSPIDHFLLLFSSTSVVTGALTVFPTMHDYTLGWSYFEALANVIYPGFITGWYLFEPMSWQFRDLYYPSVHGIAIDYSIVAEAYQNFGIVGPLVVGAVIGFALGRLFRLATNFHWNKFSPWPLLHLHVLWTTVYALRTDSNGYAKLLAYGTLWLVGLAAIASLGVQQTGASARKGSSANC